MGSNDVIVPTPPSETALSMHFKLGEFACHDGTPYPTELVQIDGQTWLNARLRPLVDTLEQIRVAAGKAPINVSGESPINILSAYRTLAHNRSVGSHDTSQHPQGRAADITTKYLSATDLHRAILSEYNAGRLPHLGGLGLYATFVHVDVRPRPEDDHLARWTGSRV